MELSIGGIPKNEVLHYLGWRGNELPQPEEERLNAAREELLRRVRPRFVWRRFPLGREGGLSVPAAELPLEGEELGEMLRDCGDCVLLAVTLGSEAERLIRSAGARDMSRLLLLDACGTAAVEAACDEAERLIRLRLAPGEYLTDRFSPGYGGFPLTAQRPLLRALEAEKRIGLTLTESLMLTPGKSVTAVLGVADRPRRKRFRGCGHCGLFETCTYRKAGSYCGRT